MTIKKSDLSRAPDFLERNFYYSEKHHLFRNLGVHVKVAKPVTNAQVYQGLRRLILKYPYITSCLQGENEFDLKFTPKKFIEFEKAYFVDESVVKPFTQDLEAAAKLTHPTFDGALDNGAPMWKLIYYPKIQYLSWIFDHTITDGGSITVYLKELVESFNHIENPTSEKLLFDLEEDLDKIEVPITSSVFDWINYKAPFAIKLAIPVLRFVLTHWAGFFPLVIEKQMHNMQFVDRKPIPFDNKKFFQSEYLINEESPLNRQPMHFTNIDRQNTAKILAKCRANKVKLQTYFMISYIATVHEFTDKYSEKMLKFVTAASFRNVFDQLDSHNDFLGNEGRFQDGFFTHAVVFYLEPFKQFSWSLCEKYHNFLHKVIRSKEWVEGYFVASKAISASNFFKTKINKVKDDTFLAYTNLGNVKFLDYGDEDKYQIEDILFTASPGAMTGTHAICLSSSDKGGLNFCIGNGDENIGNWEKFTQSLIEKLLDD